MTTDLFQAGQQGDLHAVQQVLDQNPGALESQDAYHNTVLTYAAQEGHTELVRALLARNADPRVSHIKVTPNGTNAESLAILREAALRMDTVQANANTPKSDDTDDQHGGATDAAPIHLPPPEVARMIPCKFFPNCRYGDRCVFQHPTITDGTIPPQPMFFPNGQPLPPAPGAYGMPPFMDMNAHMFHPYGPNAVPFFPQAEAESQYASPNIEEMQRNGQDLPDSVATSVDSLPSQPDAESNSSASARSQRGTSKTRSNKTRNDALGARANSGVRPACAFFARAACRYGNDCRFPHILADGVDARAAQEPRKLQDGRRGANAANTPAPDAPDALSVGAKKGGNTRNANRTAGARAKNTRRGTAPQSHKTFQRVPQSDEFPALPGGVQSDPSDSSDAAKGSNKVNFSAILSAPAPPKAQTPMLEGVQETSPASDSSKDFASVLATQSSAVAV
ncbi:hypothetical protein MVES1_003380 [Malassezia vespertilionis]|uniref:C3H1-type domain-containing protein n=1 Tax=Malassezia vespertilionis TaxID=2020962 RepID=A0A2N1J799_9BASI|nr:uncharacterized protein MVES1_003380 [Malassezia vespertilionis]PKI82438.1 hypothetical protein MVES_003621 [Malassezia vespertilionis]WFD08011.1 hypothetical protein MVES1_003380 [Malassezia vespertilionis]